MYVINKYTTTNVNKFGCVGMKEPISNYISIKKDDDIFVFNVVKFECPLNVILMNKAQRNALDFNIMETVEIETINVLPECDFLHITCEKINQDLKDDIKKALFKIPLHEKVNIDYYLPKNKSMTLNILPSSNNTIIGPNTKITYNSEANEIKKSIFKKQFNFEELGIGGLDKELKLLVTNALATRFIKDKNIIAKLNIKHEKGIILYGPSGTGKTLIARSIASIINCKPKIVNGPELLNKYVGESEKNIRELFNSDEDINVIIIDEMDSICSKRNDKNGIHNQIVNQLLTMIDGIDSKKNFLIIGMTNKFHDLDDAITRKGRFGLHIEIGLPDEEGRLDILNIHSKSILDLMENVDLSDLAKNTPNYSGAELEAIINNAKSYAISRNIDYQTHEFNENEKLKITQEDINRAKKEVIPNYGGFSKELEIIKTEEFNMTDEFISITQEILNSSEKQMNLFIECSPKIIGHLINQSCIKDNFTYIKYINSVISYKEYNNGFDELLNIYSKKSIIIFDCIEDIIEYCPLGNHFSNFKLQSIKRILNNIIENNIKLVILCTSEDLKLLKLLGFKL